MAFNPFLRSEIAAKRAANREKYLEYLAQARRIQSLPGEVISPDDLVKWGRENSFDNAVLPQVEQSVMRFGERTPENNTQVINTRVANLAAQPQEPRQPSNRNERTDALNQFFNPNAIGWGNSPVPRQVGRLPYIKSNLNNPSYSTATMASTDKVLVGDTYRDVAWTNLGKQKGGVQPFLFNKEGSPIHLSEAISPEQYQAFMGGANVPKYLNTDSRPFEKFLKANPDLSNYNITDSGKAGEFKRIQANTIADGDSILPTQGEVWGLGQELNDINKLQEDALRTRASEYIDTYRGSNDELGKDAIDAVARAGGSGSWVADNQEPYLNLFSANKQSQGASMNAADLARGGTWQSGKNQPSAALPGLTQEDFISDRMEYSPKGYPVDAPRNIVKIQGPEAPGHQLGYYDGSRYIPKGVTSLTPASEFLEPAAQWKFQPQRETLRFPTTPETPLTLAAVNDYGIAEYPGNPDNAYHFPVNLTQEPKLGPYQEGVEPEYYTTSKDLYNGRRVASLSVQRNNGTLDLTQLSSRGRWMGGGLMPERKLGRRDRTDDNEKNGFFYNPLESQYYQIQKPPGSEYLRLRSDTDLLTLEAIAADTAAREASKNYQEAPQVNPFTRQYKINQTGNEIAGVIPSGQIQGVTLPVMHEERIPGGTKFEPDYMPYAPSLAPINTVTGDLSNYLDAETIDELRTYQELVKSKNPDDLSYVKQIGRSLQKRGIPTNLTPAVDNSKQTLLDQHLADVRIGIDGAKYPLTPEATAVGYLPSAEQLGAEKTQLHNRTSIDANDKVNWLGTIDEEPPDEYFQALNKKPRHAVIAAETEGDFGYMNSPEFNRQGHVEKQWQNAKNATEDAGGVFTFRPAAGGNSVEYADPAIAPTDIVSAIEAKQQELNRNKALVTNYQTSPTAQPRNLKPSLNYGMDLDLLARTPVSSLNYMNQTINPGDAANLSRFMSNDEANKLGSIKYTNNGDVTVVPANYFNKQKKVTDVDGNTYFEDVETVNQKDLADIFDAPRAMRLPELQQRAAHLEGEIGNATGAYYRLMRMEPSPEIQITTSEIGKGKARNLAEQMEQVGMEVSRQQRKDKPDAKRVVATGSLPMNLPSESSFELPVKYNQQPDNDAVVRALVEKGKATGQIVDIGNRYRASLGIFPPESNAQTLSNFKQVMQPDGTIKIINTLPTSQRTLNAIDAVRVSNGLDALSSSYSINTDTNFNPKNYRAVLNPSVDNSYPELGGFASTLPQFFKEYKERTGDPEFVQEYYRQQQQARDEILNQVGRPQQKERIAVEPPILKPLVVPATSEVALSQVLETSPADTAANRAYWEAEQQLMTNRRRKTQTWGTQPVVNVQESPQQNFVEEQGGRFRGGRVPQFPEIVLNPNRSHHFILDDVVGGLAQKPRMDYDQSYALQQLPSSPRYASPLERSREKGLPEPLPLPLASTPTGFAEPQYQTANDFIAQSPIANDQSPMINNQYQLPNWALPAAGGVYLAAAGVNEYQRQQEAKRQQDEAGLRRLYMG